MPLRFSDVAPKTPVVSAVAFGAAATTDNRAVVACVVVPGVLRSPVRDDTRQQLRLVVLTPDGRESDQQGGPTGRGLWFGAGPRDSFFAIGAPNAGGAYVYRWTVPPPGRNTSAVVVNNAIVTAAILNSRFAAGVGPRGALYVVAEAAQPRVFVVSPNGQSDTLPLGPGTFGSTTALRLAQDVRRLAFQNERMFVACAGSAGRPPGPRATIRAFTVSDTGILVDTTWGDGGFWTGPAGFSPVDIHARENGELLCIGWTTVRSAFALTVIRIAPDGASDNQSTSPPDAPAIPNPLPIRSAIDSLDGLLIASSVPNPLAALFGPLAPKLAEWGLVSRRDQNDDLDSAFGNQGACWAQFPGYPLTVREVVPTAKGFFLVCDRPAGIQRRNWQPVVYAYGLTGQPVSDFGERGIVHHDEIPSMAQLHEAARTVAVGYRRVSNPNPFGADTFELAVTILGPGGNVGWRYGSTHDMHSAPLAVPGRNVGVAVVRTVASWGAFLAIGGWYAGPDGAGGVTGGGFVTVRHQNGQPLAAGQSTLRFPSDVNRLEPAANGMLEVTYQAGAYFEKVLIRSDLTLDPSPPVPVPPPVGGLLLPDGSRVRVHVSISTGVVPLFRMWLTRVRSDGTVDPAFGGRDPEEPFAGKEIARGGFDGVPITHVDFAGAGAFVHPGGGYLVALIAQRRYQGDFLPSPLGLLVTRWNVDGSPGTAWGNGGVVEHGGIAVVNQVLPDDPAGLVLVGAAQPLREKGVRIPTLWRIRYSDGQLDPTFGKQGVLSLSLRHGENRMALPIQVRPDGTRFVPITISEFVPNNSSETDPRQPEDLIWIDIT